MTLGRARNGGTVADRTATMVDSPAAEPIREGEPVQADVTLIERRRRLPRNLAAYLSIGTLAVIVVLALLAPLIAWHDPLSVDVRARLQPPFWYGDGDLSHPLGTDAVGRDLLTRILYGLRYSLAIGFAAVIVGGVVGVLAGLIAGYYDGRIGAFVLGRLSDVQQSIPFMVFALAVAASLGPSFRNLILVLGIGSWLFYYRIVRGEVLAIREQQFVDSAKAIGASDLRIIVRHVVPNVVPSIIVVATVYIPRLIMFAAALSFLGLGVQAPQPELGLMIAEGRDVIHLAWWITVLPGIVLAIVVLSMNTLGDWMRDNLDPMLKARRG
jgi:peptide/nickel transport system permease protein